MKAVQKLSAKDLQDHSNGTAASSRKGVLSTSSDALLKPTKHKSWP